MELAVAEIGQQSQLLEEDNSQLHGRVKQMKDDLQKMTAQYDVCRKELDDKVLELETMQLNRAKGEARCEQLIDAIRHLEEIIRVKEEELEVKDKEIQRISQDLMDQQLLSDPITPNEVCFESFYFYCDSCLYGTWWHNSLQYDHVKGQEMGETLAAELQSSLGDTPWKKQMGRWHIFQHYSLSKMFDLLTLAYYSVAKPDFIHPAAWSTYIFHDLKPNLLKWAWRLY